ncbi:ABC transporter ATP-binding protein [Gemella sanguinis]|uniref:ABC transporter ATP-binding protein n=1 Tax=Gemella sanguinis TaxID=84135 RepID=UPI00352E04E6
MKNRIKSWFALTDQGASDLIRASILSFLVYFSNMFPAMLLMILVDELLLGNVKSKYLYIVISIVVLIVIYVLLAKEYDALYSATYKESANLRIDIATTLSKLPLTYFSKHNLSDISQTVMKDVEAIEHAMSHAMAKIIGFILFFPIMSILMLVGNIYLGLSIMIPVVLSYSLILVSKRIQLKKQYENFEQLRHNSESFQEAIELQQDIKSFGLGNKIREKLNKDMDKSEKLKLKVEMVLFIPLFLSWVVAQGTLVVVIIVGTTLYASGSINLLYLIGYIFVAMKMKDIVDGLAANTSELFYLDARIKRIKELRETQIQKGKEIKLDNFGIELKNVKFGYDKDSPVLKDVSFTANQNEVTALVGVSGCGKTSILKLISRLYDYDDGQIIIDGHDIKEISTDTLYKYVSIVFQDVVLFNTSIMENIRIGRSSATDEEVMAAAKMACCDFIDDLENGYNTIVGENGATLSGGERQRLSIARAFLKDSPIVILDEISAALDVENEKKIQDSLNNLIKNKTVIVISHRLKSIENVDKIIVLDNGIVECQGTHSYLLEHSKVYGKLIERSKAVESFKY